MFPVAFARRAEWCAEPFQNMRNLFQLLEQSAEKFGDKIFSQIREGENWRRLSFKELHSQAEALAQALKAHGVKDGDSIALLSENRPEWGIAFFAILRVGGVVVPVDKLLKKEELFGILEDAESKLIIASGTYIPLLSEYPGKVPLLSLDEIDPSQPAISREIEFGRKSPMLGTFHKNREAVAVMIFTSGTTGTPKGVMLTHGNLLSNIEAFSALFPPTFFQSNFLSVLPLNHAYELTGGFLTPLAGGGAITYQASLKPANILETMRETKTRIVLTVPAFMEAIYHAVQREINISPALRKRYKLGRMLSTIFPFCGFRRWLFRELHQAFGGELRYFISGGAPLSGDLQSAFEKLGFTVIQGYGLTETAPVLTINPFHRTKRNSVGRPIPGVELKIDGSPKGEILVKGPNVMQGYYKDSETTQAVMKDGYFKTGDIGTLDSDGFLFISGRVKNIIVSSTGKKISPEELEDRLKTIPYIKEVCVVGRKQDGDERTVALIIPDAERLASANIPIEQTQSVIWESVKKINLTIADYKRVREIVLWNKEFPKTTTMKIKRDELQKELKGLSD